MSSYLKSSVALAGLLHDLGKASSAFQSKIRNRGDASYADPIRHELISVYLILATVDRLIPDLKNSATKDDIVVELIASENFTDQFQASIDGDFIRPLVDRMLDRRAIVMPRVKTHGRVLTDLCQLILVHHRLSTCEIDEAFTLTPWSYLKGGISYDAPEIRAGCAFAGGVSQFGDAGEVAAWKRSVAAAARSVAATFVGGRPPSLPPGTIQHHGRLALMLGDHHASAVGTVVGRRAVKSRIYANTASHPDGGMGQSLARHLVAVGRASAVAASALSRRLDAFPALGDDAIPDAIASPTCTGRYGWQGDAVALVRAARECSARKGFLAFVMASTGAGKTRVVPSVLLAARPEAGLRYSVGLGLRSLTLQTAREYTTRLGFHRDGVTVAIGSALARKLDRLKRRLDTVQSGLPDDGDLAVADGDPAGSEADLGGIAVGVEAEPEDPGVVAALEGEAPVLDLPGIAVRMNDTRCAPVDRRLAAARTFLAAPILVSTLDQLMPVATSTRGGHLTAALRTATADLVIDEIDSFEPEDVCAVCRLVEHAAAHGRAVVVTTATLPPPVAIALHLAYRSGWARHAALTGAPDGIDVAWLSDVPGASCLATPEPEAFAAAHAEVAGAIAAHALAQPWKRRLGYLPCAPEAGVDGYHDLLRDGIRRLHRAHHVVDPRTGCRVSAGVVRMANVRPAIDFARTLIDRGLDPLEVRVVPYVGTLLPAVRFVVEQTLDALLTRSGEVDPLVSDRLPLRGHLDRARSPDLVVVVVTTSLEETGRDHDFDWALSEPLSSRGLAQLAGRVRRHRGHPAPDAEPNLLVPELPHRSVKTPGQARPLSRPGVETCWRNAHRIETGTGALGAHHARALFQGDGWDERITAAPLVTPDTPASLLAGYERRRWSTILLDAGDGLGPARHRDNEFVGQVHQHARRFRRQHGIDIDLSLLDGRWTLLTPTGQHVPVSDRVDLLPLSSSDRLLVPVEDIAAVDRLADDLMAEMGARDAATRRDLVTVTIPGSRKGTNWRVQWHPALGSFLRIA